MRPTSYHFHITHTSAKLDKVSQEYLLIAKHRTAEAANSVM